ncbi:MAG: UDP-glucuronic acid decarboxylase family protein [bacterium]|jgi:dTDP-glucose 4,6-dehydratase
MKHQGKPFCLIAGGAGFIGSHLCDFLIKNGYRVICIDNLITGNYHNIAHLIKHPDFQFIPTDIIKTTELKKLPRVQLAVIFNLASPASPQDYLAHPLETMRAGAEGTRNLLELALRNRAIFIQASTSEVYGDPQVNPQPESYWGNVNPVGPRAVYDEAKRYAEALVMTYHRLYQLPTRIARIFNTYGPRMKISDGRVVPTLIHQALNHRPLTIFGTGKQTRSFCYVTDMVNGLYRLIKCNDPYPVNLGNPEEVTILQLARAIKKITRSHSQYSFLPLPADDPQQRKPDITRARKMLSWYPRVGLKRGLSLTVNWFRLYLQHSEGV